MEEGWRTNPEKYRGSLWDYYEDRFLEIRGTKTRYWSEGGEGEPLVLIHGYMGSVEEWAWNIPALKKKYRVLALDLPGFGLADKPDVEYDYEYFAAFVSDFMENLGIRQAHIMGHSMGGAIAINLALLHPEKVRSLILVAPAFGRKYPFAMHLASTPVLGEMLMRPPASPAKVAASFRYLTYEPINYAEVTVERNYQFQHSPGYARACLKFLRNYFTAFGFTALGEKLLGGYYENISRISMPVFLAWGPQDGVVGFESSRDLRALLPHAEFWSPDPCGHCPNFEYPEEFNERALDFLGRS